MASQSKFKSSSDLPTLLGGLIVRMHPSLPSTLLVMGIMSSVTSAETKLVAKIEEFKDVWIENATKTLVDGPTKEDKALRIEVYAKQSEEWQAQTWVRPLAGNVAEGDSVEIAFDARAIEPAAAGISITLGLGDAPYTQVVKKQFEFGQNWQHYEFTEVAKHSLAATDGRFGFTFGTQIQTFEICKLTVTNKPK
jgi:hypothetical protein